MFLYKYRADTEYTAKIFTTKKVWLSTAEELNDPFECEIQVIDENLRQAQVQKMKEAQLTGFFLTAHISTKKGTPFFGLSKKETRKLLQEFGRLKEFDKKYQKMRLFIKGKTGAPPSDPGKVFSSPRDQLSTVGIFSLSAVPDNLLMWAHYAQDHRGICLGFEITDGSVLADAERFLCVEYGNSTPKVDDQTSTELTVSLDKKGSIRTEHRLAFSDPSLRAAISTKGSEWGYEQEWRYVEPIHGEYDWPAPIVEITFGLRCPQDRRDFYINLAHQSISNEVRFYEIRKILNTKAIERIRLHPNAITATTPSSVATIDEVLRLMGRGQFTVALPLIDELLRNDAKSVELWRCRGIVLGWSERHEDALKCFDSAIDLDSKNFSVWYQKGVALLQLERYDEAISAYLKAQELYEYEPSIAFNLGITLAFLQRHDEAIPQLERAAELGHPRAAYNLKLLKSQMAEN